MPVPQLWVPRGLEGSVPTLLAVTSLPCTGPAASHAHPGLAARQGAGWVPTARSEAKRWAPSSWQKDRQLAQEGRSQGADCCGRVPRRCQGQLLAALLGSGAEARRGPSSPGLARSPERCHWTLLSRGTGTLALARLVAGSEGGLRAGRNVGAPGGCHWVADQEVGKPVCHLGLLGWGLLSRVSGVPAAPLGAPQPRGAGSPSPAHLNRH